MRMIDLFLFNWRNRLAEWKAARKDRYESHIIDCYRESWGTS